MSITAKVITDSVGPSGVRLTTMVLRYPRMVHAEFMTHRAFSRNASSSRAIPVSKLIAEAENDPALPVHWGANQKGMQARAELDDYKKSMAMAVWDAARKDAVAHAKVLADERIGLHKQLVNRLLEPFTHISVVATGTEDGYANFYNLRNHEDAEPAICALAQAMLGAHKESTPVSRGLHVPFVTLEECDTYGVGECLKLSTARCARVSYLNHDGTSCVYEKDVELHDRLLASGHFSPFEHQAIGVLDPYGYSGNFRGWLQYRKTLANENQTRYEKLASRA